ncbi:MAG: type 4b pilus protein PilO2 [Alphaproteobacteria bacterium]
MFGYIITVKKRKFATGLLWQPVAAGYTSRSYSRTLSKNVNKKYNLYTEYRSIVGVGSKSFGHRNGMMVAAVQVMNSLSEYSAFLSAFDLGDSFYIVAVRNGVVLMDKVFETETSARTEYSKMAELPDWGAFIAPSKWAMPRAVERDLYSLLVNANKIVLKPINRLDFGIVPLLVLCAFLFAIYYFFSEPIDKMKNTKKFDGVDPQLIQEYKQKIELKNKELDKQYDIQRTAEVKPLVMPYSGLPDPQERAILCYKAIGLLMQPVLGWNQVSASCEKDTAVVQFNRSFGTVGDFYNVAGNLMPGGSVQEVSENVLNVSVSLPKLKLYESQDEKNPDDIVRSVVTLFQKIKTSVDTKIVIDTITNGVDSVDIPVIEVGASSKLIPMQFMEIFGDFDGVYMTRCTWNTVKRIWNYEVIIYAK